MPPIAQYAGSDSSLSGLRTANEREPIVKGVECILCELLDGLILAVPRTGKDVRGGCRSRGAACHRQQVGHTGAGPQSPCALAAAIGRQVECRTRVFIGPGAAGAPTRTVDWLADHR